MTKSPLTPRERECAALLAEGLSNKEIGKKLGLSDSTIKCHLRSVYLRLRVRNRVAAAILLQRQGI
jgi:DNA-binding NarL/FixJ family response regulator